MEGRFPQVGQTAAEDLWNRLDLERRLIERDIDRGEFDHLALDPSTLLELHLRLCRRFAPQLGGWRCIALSLPPWCPPPPAALPRLLQAHLRESALRLGHDGARGREGLIEALAYLEGGLLCLHPFSNLCEPTVRLLLRLQLRQLGRPGVALDVDTTALYLQALQAGWLCRWDWLVPVWRLRLDAPRGQSRAL